MIRYCFCAIDGDVTDQLQGRRDADYCPLCGTRLVWFNRQAAREVIETTKKNKKLKVMHIEAKHARETTKSESKAEVAEAAA